MSLSRRFPRVALAAASLAALVCAAAGAVRPGPRAWRGAARGMVVVASILTAIVVVYGALLPVPTLDRLLKIGRRLGLALLAGGAVYVAAHLFVRLPRRYRAYLAASAAISVSLLERVGDWAGWLAAACLLVAGSLAGAGWRVVTRGGMGNLSRLQTGLAMLGLLGGFGSLIGLSGWLAWHGSEPLPLRDAGAESACARASAEVAAALGFTPSGPGLAAVKVLLEPGPETVVPFTYGTGHDRRLEFGRDVDWRTDPIDGSPFLDKWNPARTRFWGFDDTRLPLQGRVWMPRECFDPVGCGGPLPLVLIVHGNHSMEQYSDPGYEYLGVHLASRGMIAVSVDENFLNSSTSGGMRGENDARGWLLLEHLRQWRTWNADPASPVFGKVDLHRIALIGHSRGGEAVAVAAAFNRLARYPDDAAVRFAYGFEIGAVVAIAPVYGQYRPAGELTRLRDVNYLAIHGAHDGDVTSFAGSAQYQAVRFSAGGYHFKATVYVGRANHGQFNTVWGDTDWGRPWGWLLNRRPLLAGEQQRRVARLFITAFLEAALRGRHDLLQVFLTPPRALLPATVYITDFEDSRFRTVADFDEDIDVTTTSLPGGSIWSDNLSVWREGRYRLKSRDRATRAVFVGWESSASEADGDGAAPPPDSTPRYRITLPDGFGTDGFAALTFTLADAKEDPSPDRHDHREGEQTPAREESIEPSDEPTDSSEPREPLDLTVRLVDADGQTALVPLHRFSLLQPQIEVQVRKPWFGKAERKSEAIPQRFVLPLVWFVRANPQLDVARLRTIEWVFDRSPRGVVVLDDVGFR